MTRDSFPVVVHVLLLRARKGGGDEVFLLRRQGTGLLDGSYVLPGGHARRGERLRDAALRECREETGVEPACLEPAALLTYRSGGEQGLNVVFEGSRLDAEPTLGEPHRADAAGWFAVGALPQPLAPWIHELLALRQRGGWFRELHD